VKLLYVLRHAKSSRSDPTLADPDRPLAPRGRRESARLAAHLQRERIDPALVLCSSARRARETLAALLPALEGEAELRLEDGLYAAEAGALLERLHAVPALLPSVLLIGHNPGLHELLLHLLGPERAPQRLPTAALATLAIPAAGWQQLAERDAELAALVVARELRS
jgi:phosphohistidine phosphatase